MERRRNADAPVEGTRESIKSSRVGQVRVRECRAHQICGPENTSMVGKHAEIKGWTYERCVRRRFLLHGHRG